MTETAINKRRTLMTKRANMLISIMKKNLSIINQVQRKGVKK